MGEGKLIGSCFFLRLSKRIRRSGKEAISVVAVGRLRYVRDKANVLDGGAKDQEKRVFLGRGERDVQAGSSFLTCRLLNHNKSDLASWEEFRSRKSPSAPRRMAV